MLARRFLPLLVVLALIVIAFVGVVIQGKLNLAAIPVFPALLQTVLMGAVVVLALTAYGFYEHGKRGLVELSAMRDSLVFKDAVLESLPDAYVLVDPQGKITQQAGIEKIIPHMRLADVQELYDLVQPASAEKLQQHMRDIVTRDTQFNLNVRLGKKSGSKDNQTFLVRGLRQSTVGAPPSVLLWLSDVSRYTEEIRRQTENLHQANSKLQDLRGALNGLPFPIWQRGSDLKLTWINDGYAAVMGKSVDAVLAEQIELVPIAQRGKGKKGPAEHAHALGGSYNEDRHVVVGGARRLMRITETRLGVDSGIMGYAVDITHEAELDSELKRHIKAHEDVLDQMAAPIAIYGADTRLKFFNRAYIKLWDSNEEFLKTEPSLSEVLEDLRERRRAPEQVDFQKYKKERTSLFTSLIEPREDLMHLPDGTTLRIMAMPHPFGGIMFVHEDVTDKLALESSYNTLIAVQRETLDHLAEGTAVCGSDGRLKLYNPAFMRIWKLSEDQLVDHPHLSDVLEMMRPLFAADNWDDFKRTTIAEMLDRTTRAGRYERADGAVIEYSCVPLPDGAVLVSYLDVSDSVLAEQALRETNIALAAADRLKSEFVANVSYQLRTPLNTIMGFAEILTNQYFGALNERQMDYARTIMEASRKLLHLINDVLDMATIEAGRMVLAPRDMQVKVLLDMAAEMTQDWAKQRDLTIHFSCDEAIGGFEVDEHRMKQVMFNLISNAIQYTAAGGHIDVTAHRNGDWIEVVVDDDGMGIPPEDQERIFGKFEKANPQVQSGGAGLGLALVRSFVELHGGRVVIDSRVNEGTKVTCSLPIKIFPRHARRLAEAS